MKNFNNILDKLEAFIRRYYTNELIKGAILFFSIGLLYFLFTLFVEHLLWLSTTSRTILFWVFVVVELMLFVKFIAVPLAKLFKLQKGIDYITASKIIGNHFTQVNDKLLNVLQLKESKAETELLLASIEQKSIELSPVPFKLAVNFKKNRRYLKYAAIPLAIILLSYVTGKINWFSDSYKRIVNYKTAYEPPAPFQFFVLNENLTALENQSFKLLVSTAGDVLPESAQIAFNSESYYLQSKGSGVFEYEFTQLATDVNFTLTANGVSSKPYTINVVKVPTLLDFQMVLDYPQYTLKQDETLKSTGNAIVPEGTTVTWQLNTRATDAVNLYAKDTLLFTSKEKGVFETKKRIFNNLDYSINTSNAKLKDYEHLAFRINVVKDEYPEINLKSELDSLDQQSLYFYGQVSDDYGLSKLQLVYYPVEDENAKKIETIEISKTTVDDFVSAFPDQLNLTEGVSYELYFQVFDNDIIHNYKSVKSSVFSYRKLTKDEEEQKQLQEQNETIEDLNNSLEKFEEQDKQLEEFSKTQKEKSELNFNDKKKLENFLKRQEQQEEMMKNFNKRLQENLEEFQNEDEDPFKEDLKERLKENEEQLQQDEKLLEELKKLQDKISKEELSEKLEQLAKQNKNKKRSLEQLLELTKRYYVGKKLEKLQQELEELARKQEELSKAPKEENTKEKQDHLNQQFENFQKELEELQKENKSLKQPMEVPQDKLTEKEITEEQQKASEELQKKEEQNSTKPEEQLKEEQQQNLNKAKQSQKKAAQKMKQMAQQMQQGMQMSGGEQLNEDLEMLRQILDNLVLFSLDEEDLMNAFKGIEINHNNYAAHLRKQSSLREHFEHIDDSLFALSLRQPKLSEKVNKEITEVFFNLDKALNQFSENRLYQGVASQQYTITAANNLADFLSDILDNMQQSAMPSPGQGEGDMQLPDIIMSQEELNKQMEEGLKKGENEGENEQQGEKEGDQEGEKEGKKPSDGKQGKEGKEGNSQKEGEGAPSNEGVNGELYEIYKRQQQLRQALQDKLAKEGKRGVGSNLIKEMENIELELLNKGFTNKILQRMMQLKHQLLKLENATFQQGEDNKRQSKTNQQQFNNTTKGNIIKAKEYFNTTEILNRQALPLRQNYKMKVQEYFKGKND